MFNDSMSSQKTFAKLQHFALFVRFQVHNSPHLAATPWIPQLRFYADYPNHIKVPLPALSPTMETGIIVTWHKKEGDKLNEGDLLAEVKTDKATMGFKTPEEGYLAKILIPGGTKNVAIGKLVCIIVSDESSVAAFKDFKDQETSDVTPPSAASTPPAQVNFTALSKFLNPKNDVAFRRIFGTEKNKDILIHFLNDILGFTGKNAIQDIEFLSTVQDPDIASKKQSIVDVLCRDSSGIQYVCEMQVAKTKGFEKRAQYYAAKAYSRQADKGDQYHNFKEIIFIAITDCVLFPNKFEYKSKHTIRDEDTNEHDLKDFYFIFIELPKFPKNKKDRLENIVEKWVYFFRYADETSEEELEKIIGSDVIIKKAYEELNRFNWSEKEFIAYEQEIKRILDEQAVLAQKLDDARDEGILIGHEKGILIGRRAEKIEVAKNLLDENPAIAAQMLCDKHIVKMPLEIAQLLSNVFSIALKVPNPLVSITDQNIEVPYKLTHKNHPCSLWARHSKGNFNWLIKDGKELCIEYSLRYKRTHKSEEVIDWCDNNKGLLIFQSADIQIFTQALPDRYKCSNPIEAYREYYLKEKMRFAKWEKGREALGWIICYTIPQLI